MEFFEVHGVDKVYGTTKALSKVSLEVKEGSIFGLLGPNGAGKTTLIRIINQITAPDQGEIFFNGRKLQGSDIERIGYLPEERGLYKKMKIGEQALYLAQLKGMSTASAMKSLRHWFEKFGIMSWWNKKVEELSKGMQQKVQFITTVVHKPELLIFDEPFSGFDPINAMLLKKELLQLRDEGATIIFSTHDMGSVEELCDHIALINKSEKILDGPVDQIREQFKLNSFEIEFRGVAENITNVLGDSVKIIELTEKNSLKKMKFRYLNGITNNKLLELLVHQIEIVSFREHIPSMNDVFIQAVESFNQEKK